MRVIADFETRSGADLRQVPPHRYATDSEADILCLTWQIVDCTDTHIWFPGDNVPYQLIWAIECGWTFVFHNAEFDAIIWNEIAVPRYGFPPLPVDLLDCTAARAAAVHLPRALAHIGLVLRLDEQKLATGKNVLSYPGISKPRTPTKNDPRRWYGPKDKPELWREMAHYALQDTVTTAELDKKLAAFPVFEREVFHANVRINGRGLRIDVPLAQRVQSLLDYEERTLIYKQLDALTEGYVQKLTQLPAIKQWLKADGLDVVSLKESARLELLQDNDLSLEARTVIELLNANKAAVKKLPAMLRSISPDGRARGLFRYCGASQTMRFSGEKVQPQNLARPDEAVSKNPGMSVLRYELANYSAELLSVMFGSVAQAVANAIRTFFIPDAGKVFVAVDLAQIELRVLSWLAGDYAMLDTLRKKGDPYARMGAAVFNIPLDQAGKGSDARQLGKIIILACGYQMGPGTFRFQSKTQYNLDVSEELAERSIETYRAERKTVPRLWHGMQNAAMLAIRNPNSATECGLIQFRFNKAANCLQMRLPSGHKLHYWNAHIAKAEHPAFPEPIDQIFYRNIRGFAGGAHKTTYGGKLTENAVQSIARHILCDAMVRMDIRRLPMVLHAHDEIMAEVPSRAGQATHDYMIEAMTQVPAWADGLPLDAEGWIGDYYRK